MVVIFRGDSDPAFSQPQVEQLVNIGVALEQDILAHDSDIRRPVFNVNRDVGWLDKQVTHPIFLVFKYEFAVVLVN